LQADLDGLALLGMEEEVRRKLVMSHTRAVVGGEFGWEETWPRVELLLEVCGSEEEMVRCSVVNRNGFT
jgi:hypothetical protein